MKKMYKTNIDRKLAESISCAAYLSDSHKNVLISILSNPDININDKLFCKYVDAYTEAFMYEQEVKIYMEGIYIRKIPAKNINGIVWNLTYATGELLIEIDDRDMAEDTDSFLLKSGFERTE